MRAAHGTTRTRRDRCPHDQRVVELFSAENLFEPIATGSREPLACGVEQRHAFCGTRRERDLPRHSGLACERRDRVMPGRHPRLERVSLGNGGIMNTKAMLPFTSRAIAPRGQRAWLRM